MIPLESKKKTIGYTESEDYRCLEDLQDVGGMESIRSFQLDYCGIERCKPGHAFGPHIRKHYVIHIVREGEGYLRRNGKCWTIGENQAFLLRPGEEALYEADQDHPWIYAWVGFHGYLSEKLISKMGFPKDEDVIRVADAKVLFDYISKMLDHNELTYAGNLKRSALLMLLAAEIIEYANVPAEEDSGFSEEAYVNLAVKEIISNYDRPMKISAIAGKIGINRSYLSIIFKKRMGVSPQQYLIDTRLDKAAELLADTDMAVRMVAAQVGYTDPLTFSKAFKQRFGESPSTYREHPPELLKKTRKGAYTGNHQL